MIAWGPELDRNALRDVDSDLFPRDEYLASERLLPRWRQALPRRAAGPGEPHDRAALIRKMWMTEKVTEEDRHRDARSPLAADTIATEMGSGPREMMQPGTGNQPRLFVLLLLGLVAAGCAVRSAHDRGTVSEQVLVQTGHALRPAPGTGPSCRMAFRSPTA